MKKNILKNIKIILVILAITTLVVSSIVSLDSHDIDKCQVENCAICNIIHVAQAVITIAFTIFIYKSINFLIYFFLSRFPKIRRRFVAQTLVFQNIQLNE